MTTATDQYSPFQRELLSHLCQISSNMNTLLQVFGNLQSQLTQTKAPQIKTNTNTKADIATLQLPTEQSPAQKDDITTIKEEIAAPINIKPVKQECKEEKKTNDEDTPLSLDSSDTDDENSNNSNNNCNGNGSGNHLPTYNNNNNKNKNKYSWKYRNKFGLNRSKSTSGSASMSTLLRANHIRNHKYKKKAYDQIHQKSDYAVRRTKKNKNKGPKFNPEHVFLSKKNRTIVNVGGSLYETTLNTLSADQSSMLAAMFSGRFKIERDENGSIFIDRDPTHFRHILNFLRDGIEYLKHGGLLQQPDAIVNELLQEAKYYNIRPLVDYIQLQQTRKNKKNGDELTHEKQYKLVTNIGMEEFEDVFNKYTGSAGYDFEEWLFVSPYKTSRNNSSQPTFIILFSKKLSRAEVRLLDRLTNIDFQ